MGKFTFTQTEIPGVVVIEPQVFGDDRGYFMETIRRTSSRQPASTRNSCRTTRAAPPAVCCAACISRRTTPRASWCV